MFTVTGKSTLDLENDYEIILCWSKIISKLLVTLASSVVSHRRSRYQILLQRLASTTRPPRRTPSPRVRSRSPQFRSYYSPKSMSGDTEEASLNRGVTMTQVLATRVMFTQRMDHIKSPRPSPPPLSWRGWNWSPA